MMIDLTQTAFLDLDTQYDFMVPEGNLYVPGAKDLISGLAALVRLAIMRDLPIIASVDTHIEDDSEFRVFSPHCVKGTPGHEKIPQTIHPNPLVVTNQPQHVTFIKGQELIIEKSIYSIFDNVNTDNILRSVNKKHFILFGVATEYCVRVSALGLLERHFEVTVVFDAVAAVTEVGGDKALAEMEQAGINFITTSQVLDSVL